MGNMNNVKVLISNAEYTQLGPTNARVPRAYNYLKMAL